MRNLALTRFTRNAIRVLKLIVGVIQNPLASRFLWFTVNKLVSYPNKPLLNQEFFNAGLFDYHQQLNSENEMYSHDEMAPKFELNPNNFSFIKYIKLVAAIPPSWLNKNTDRNYNHFHNLSSLKQKIKNHISILGK